MPCHYCGRELGFRSLVDKDFCSASHRRKYHEQIRRNLVEPPSGPPAGIAAFHFELPASNREAALAMVSAETVARRDTLAGPCAATLAIEAPLGAAFRAGVVAIRPRQTKPAGAVCRGPMVSVAGAENCALAAWLESECPALWRNLLHAGAALHVPGHAPAGRNAAEPEPRFLSYTFPHSSGALPLEKPRHFWGLRSLSPNLGAAAPAAAELRTISAPAPRRARRPQPPALHKTFVPAWDGAGEHVEVNAKARPARPRRLLHGAAAMAAPRTAAPQALPPLRSDIEADSSMPAAVPDPCRPAMAPLTISIQPVEPAAKVAARRTRATAPGMPLVAAGFSHAGARPCAPRFSLPARAAVFAPAATPAFAQHAARPAFTISVFQVGGPSSVALEAAPRAVVGRREAAPLTFGCRTTAPETRCVPAPFSPAPERRALASSSRYFEYIPEASMWRPEPAPKSGVLSVASPGEETGSLRAAAPRMAGPARDGARAQQLETAPWTFPCMAPAPVEARIEGFELNAALRPFQKEFKAWTTRRHRFGLAGVWRYSKPAVAAAMVLVAMALGILAVVQRTPAAIERRATVEWNESFRSGLKLWRGGSSWTVDKAGYARPMQLAVFVPSRELSNYRLHFLTQIEAKGVGWAFRVRDARNYYGAELRVSKPGPRPLLDLVRYTVVAGRRQDEVRVPLNVMAHNSVPFQVTLEAHGDSFRVELEGETVDEWTDGRWPSGGIGFFGDSGSRARIYWVQFASHPDWLGRLCALFTTHNQPVTAQIQPAEADDDGNDGEFRIRRVGTGRSRVRVTR